jgi:hypothetical protein
MSDVEFSYSSYSFIQINRGSLIRAQSSEWSILYGACRVLATSWNHLEPVYSSIPCAFAALLVFLSPGDMTGWVTMIAAFPEATHTHKTLLFGKHRMKQVAGSTVHIMVMGALHGITGSLYVTYPLVN